MIQTTHVFTAFDHPDFKLNEQQEAVLDRMHDRKWYLAYDLHGAEGFVKSGRRVTIGDAGRRMRELRQEGLLESRKRGRFEEYRIIPGGSGGSGGLLQRCNSCGDLGHVTCINSKTRTVHSREEANDLEERGWTILTWEIHNGFFTSTLQAPKLH